VRIEVSAMGENMFPNREPPYTAPKQCRSTGREPPPSVHASGPIRGNKMPMVPNEEPVAKEIAYASNW